MPGRQVRIEEMVLRIPGLTREQATRVAKQVTQRLAERLPRHGSSAEYALLNKRIEIPDGTPVSELPARIASALLETLR